MLPTASISRWLRPTRWPLPGGCWICRAWSGERLCTACLTRFAAPRPRCPHCALPQPSAMRCGACLSAPLPLTRVICAVDYQPPWDELLRSFKYGQALGLLPALAALLWRALPPLQGTPLLMPVPLHERRLGERGYDQSALLAGELAAQLGLPSSQGLRRVVDTPSQTRLGRRARMANLRHAFAPTAGLGDAVRGRHCVLVDDVMTTGATLATIAPLLLRHGAARVDAWVLARTPEPD